MTKFQSRMNMTPDAVKVSLFWFGVGVFIGAVMMVVYDWLCGSL